MLRKDITFMFQPCVLACDGQCHKAWGINNRPRIEFGEDDDFAYLADSELDTAPEDTGIYEGGHAKPRHPAEQLNKWCARECERSGLYEPGEEIKLNSFAERVYNMPWKH